MKIDRQMVGLGVLAMLFAAGAWACGGGGTTGPSQPQTQTLSVSITGDGTVTSSLAGINCSTGNTGTCSAGFTTGASVTLTAAAASGWNFGGWGGACSGAGTCEVTMTTTRSVSATFNQPSVGEVNEISFSNNSGTATLVTPNGTEEFILAVYSLGDSSRTFNYSVSTPGSGTIVAGLAEFTQFKGRGSLDLEIQIRLAARRTLASGFQEISPTFTAFQQPEEGDTLQFLVLNAIPESAANATCDTVTAVLRRKSTNVLLFVDTEVTNTELDGADVTEIGSSFDPGSYTLVRNTFGTESDVNRDGHVTVLMTPGVNRLTPAGEAQERGFIGGFFFSPDLGQRDATTNPCSNEQEIFFTFVPDPTNRFGNTLVKAGAIQTIKTVLPHEYEHMINLNQHFFVARCNCIEDTWLDEGLAHTAEDVGGFPQQNVGERTRRFVQSPNLNTLLIPEGQEGKLELRGAVYLFVRRLADVVGGDILLRLTSTGQVGKRNVASKVGRSFDTVFRNWVATLFLSGRGLNGDPLFNYTIPAVNDILRQELKLESLSLASPSFSGQVSGHAAQFIRASGSTAESVTLRITGGAGSNLRGIFIRTR